MQTQWLKSLYLLLKHCTSCNSIFGQKCTLRFSERQTFPTLQTFSLGPVLLLQEISTDIKQCLPALCSPKTSQYKQVGLSHFTFLQRQEKLPKDQNLYKLIRSGLCIILYIFTNLSQARTRMDSIQNTLKL